MWGQLESRSVPRGEYQGRSQIGSSIRSAEVCRGPAVKKLLHVQVSNKLCAMRSPECDSSPSSGSMQVIFLHFVSLKVSQLMPPNPGFVLLLHVTSLIF